jgi:DNA modification methylase
MLTLRGEKAALWKAWRRKDQTFYECAIECRAVGIHWGNIKVLIRAHRKAGENITIERWTKQNAPVSKRWLDQYSEFAHRWGEFIEAWKWAQAMPYHSERRPSLHSLQDLMLAKQRYDAVSRTRQIAYGGRGGRSAVALGNSVPISAFVTSGDIERLTPTTGLICGDSADSLRAHIPDGAADIAIVDPPFWVSRYFRASAADRYILVAGMTPRFDQQWDRFDSVEHYEREAERWLTEIMRCLKRTGSAFIMGTYHNIGMINRLCQLRDYYIINEIIWVVRNSRPNAFTKKLRHSHQSVLWIAKEIGEYNFNYRACKQRAYVGDYFSQRGKQMCNVWDIPAAPHENRLYGHPTPKPVALYQRMLDTAGRPGGLLIELFAGSGPGGIAAMRWGMESISIERDPKYCNMIRRRVADELKRQPPI